LRNTAEEEYPLMSIILGVVDSLPFQMRAKVVEPDAVQTTAQSGE
jgi:hypothetical protein